MDQPHELLRLWDFGWCLNERIPLPLCRSADDVIREYRRSIEFGTSFIEPSEVRKPELHGPFQSSLIAESDFERLTPQRFLDEVDTIRRIEEFTSPPDDRQWEAVVNLASDVSSRHTWLFMLRFTEKNEDRFHDWGYVFSVFREFVCASPNTECVDRIVFGYD